MKRETAKTLIQFHYNKLGPTVILAHEKALKDKKTGRIIRRSIFGLLGGGIDPILDLNGYVIGQESQEEALVREIEEELGTGINIVRSRGAEKYSIWKQNKAFIIYSHQK